MSSQSLDRANDSRPTLPCHVLFSPSAAATLKRALENKGRGDRVLTILDNFSFGPIAAMDAGTRIRWAEQELGYADWQGAIDATAAFLESFALHDGPVTVWTSRREAASYAGFLWFLSEIGDVPLSVAAVANLSITHVARMAELLDCAIPLPAEDRARHRARWRQLRLEDAPLRVISGHVLVSAPIDHFDAALLGHAEPEWRKMAMIVARALADFHDAGIHQTGDLVLGARLRHLAEAGRLEHRGCLADMRRCELRLPSGRREPGAADGKLGIW